MNQLEEFIGQCEKNCLDTQQVEAHLASYRQNLPSFIESLLRLSDRFVLAFIVLKNEIKTQSDPALFYYVLKEMHTLQRVPAPLYSEVVFICCQRLNEIPDFVIEECKRACDLGLLSKLLNLHC